MDTLLFNGKITTLDVQQPEVTAIGIQNGMVAAIGSDEDISKLASKDTQKIDL